MIDNKDIEYLKACKSEIKCGNYFYGPRFEYCRQCRTKGQY